VRARRKLSEAAKTPSTRNHARGIDGIPITHGDILKPSGVLSWVFIPSSISH
jgi:hypothetical protein